MTALNKQALREASEKATPGEWRRASTRFNGITAQSAYPLCGKEDILASAAEKRDAEFIAAANPATVLALLDELEAAEKRIEEGICRANREHHRGFMMACNHLKEHANIHYADAAEMEIAALRQRINQLEARTVTMPPKEHDNGTDSQIDINAGFANRMWQKCADAIRAAGIGVKGK